MARQKCGPAPPPAMGHRSSAIGWSADVAHSGLIALRSTMQIAGRDEINGAIAELVAMLRSDYGWQADVLMRLREAVNGQDRQAVEELFGSGDIWGGAGSVHDVSFCDAVLDERKRKLLIELVDASRVQA